MQPVYNYPAEHVFTLRDTDAQNGQQKPQLRILFSLNSILWTYINQLLILLMHTVDILCCIIMLMWPIILLYMKCRTLSVQRRYVLNFLLHYKIVIYVWVSFINSWRKKKNLSKLIRLIAEYFILKQYS